MKLHSDGSSGKNRITAYGPGYVDVNGQRITRSLVVTADTLDVHWPPLTWEHLTGQHLSSIMDLSPEIVLLGSGPVQQLAAPHLLEAMVQINVGFEVMTTAAACRTYNILLAEGRAVAAGLIVT